MAESKQSAPQEQSEPKPQLVARIEGELRERVERYTFDKQRASMNNSVLWLVHLGLKAEGF